MTRTQYTKPKRRATAAWILYDFANTAFSMNVVSLYFATWLIIELKQHDFIVGFANSLSMIFVALTMPFLGEISDKKGNKLWFLGLYTSLCIFCTALIGIAGISIKNVAVIIILAPLFFVIANYGYQGGLVFYNALMPAVSTPKTIGRISGYGVAFGYLGAIVGLFVARIFVEGHLFGLSIPWVKAGGAIGAFIPTAVLFFIFAIPVFIFVSEPQLDKTGPQRITLLQSLSKVFDSIVNSKKYPGLLRFLIAKFLYENGIQTVIIFMGVYTQTVMGFSLGQANLFFMIVIPSAVIGSAFCGILTDHYGAKQTLIGVIAGWLLCLTIIIISSNQTLFWVLGCIVGALMGSAWTSARPLLISLVPEKMLGEFFGLYALSGTLATVVGPLIWGGVVEVLDNYDNVFKYKAAILALIFLMTIGFVLLFKIPDYHRKHLSPTLPQ